MEILIRKKLFLEGLEIAKDSVEKQATLPILKNIKLTAKENSLKLYTTNLTIGSLVSLRDLSVLSEGETLCDALNLIATVKELPDKEVRIFKEEGDHLIVECGKSHFKLLTMPPEEFPSEPQPPEEELFPIREEFFDSLRKIKYAASKKVEKRYTLNGIYFGTEVVATDGYRMAMVKKGYPFEGIIVPLDFINLTLKLNNKAKLTTFKAGCAEDKIFIKNLSGDLLLYSRLLDGTFPDYSQVIPTDSKRWALMDRPKLSQVIKRVLLMSGENFQVRFEFNPSFLTLSSFLPNLGDSLERIEIEYGTKTEEDKPFVIALNGRYLLEALETLKEEGVTFLMNDEVSAVKIEENDAIHILMPLRLPESEEKSETAKHGFSEETE